MNTSRRQRIITAHALLEEIVEAVGFIRDEEQEALDNMPDNLRESDRGQALEQSAADLEEAHTMLENAARILEEVSE